MAERGIDISGHAPTHFERFARTRFDEVVTLCDKVREVCPEFPGGPAGIHWSTADPAADPGSEQDSYHAYQRTVSELEVRIGYLIARLSTNEGGRLHAR
jgi:protein-tyrosine-phosphatase